MKNKSLAGFHSMMLKRQLQDHNEHLRTLCNFFKKKHNLDRLAVDCINRVEAIRCIEFGIDNIDNYVKYENFLIVDDEGKAIQIDDIKASYENSWREEEIMVFKELLDRCKRHDIFLCTNGRFCEIKTLVMPKGLCIENLEIEKDLQQ